MAVYVEIPENPNCRMWDGQVFQCRTKQRTVKQVRMGDEGSEEWCDVTGITESGEACAATACIIEDSGEGACYLVVGGAWGLRFRRNSSGWAFDNLDQWGEPFLILGGDGADLRFDD
jgi:hypothetical protein